MTYAEELFRLRKRMLDAAGSGVFTDESSKNIVEALLIQIMNDGEKSRQQSLSQAEALRKQAATLEGQASAFASITSIVYNVLNGFIHSTEIANADDKRVAKENEEKAEFIEKETAKVKKPRK